jgi:hypothetical protein
MAAYSQSTNITVKQLGRMSTFARRGGAWRVAFAQHKQGHAPQTDKKTHHKERATQSAEA